MFPRFLLSLRLAISGIFENRLRAVLTMLGIIIGIASVVAIMAIGKGAESLITGSVEKIGTNLVGVLPGSSSDSGPPASAMGISIKTLTYDDAMAIKKLPEVVGVSAYARGNGELVVGKESLTGTFSGITPDYPEVENHTVERGRFFTAAEERTNKRVAVLGAEMVEELFPYTDPIGKSVRIRGLPFTVIGIMEKKGASLVSNPDDQIFIPLSTAQNILLNQNHLGLIRVKISSEELIPGAMERIRHVLRTRHDIKTPADDDFSVRSLSQAVDMLSAILMGLRVFLASIAAVSLVVGGIGIMNIMLMTVKQRTREIGLKKAIGATPAQIRSEFLLEAVLLTGMGGFIGTLLGIGVSFAIAVAAQGLGYNWEFFISFLAIALAIFTSTLVGIIFGLYPARKAAQMNPIDALRYE